MSNPIPPSRPPQGLEKPRRLSPNHGNIEKGEFCIVNKNSFQIIVPGGLTFKYENNKFTEYMPAIPHLNRLGYIKNMDPEDAKAFMARVKRESKKLIQNHPELKNTVNELVNRMEGSFKIYGTSYPGLFYSNIGDDGIKRLAVSFEFRHKGKTIKAVYTTNINEDLPESVNRLSFYALTADKKTKMLSWPEIKNTDEIKSLKEDFEKYINNMTAKIKKYKKTKDILNIIEESRGYYKKKYL